MPWKNTAGVETSAKSLWSWLIGPKREGVDAKSGVLGIMQYGRRSRFITKIRLQKYYDRVQLSLNPDNMGKSLTRKWREFGPKIINSPSDTKSSIRPRCSFFFDDGAGEVQSQRKDKHPKLGVPLDLALNINPVSDQKSTLKMRWPVRCPGGGGATAKTDSKRRCGARAETGWPGNDGNSDDRS